MSCEPEPNVMTARDGTLIDTPEKVRAHLDRISRQRRIGAELHEGLDENRGFTGAPSLPDDLVPLAQDYAEEWELRTEPPNDSEIAHAERAVQATHDDLLAADDAYREALDHLADLRRAKS